MKNRNPEQVNKRFIKMLELGGELALVTDDFIFAEREGRLDDERDSREIYSKAAEGKYINNVTDEDWPEAVEDWLNYDTDCLELET